MGTKHKKWGAIQRHRGKFFLGALLLSVVVHGLTFTRLSRSSDPKVFGLNQKNQPPVKVRIVQVPKEKPKVEPETPDPEDIPKILETPQLKTEKPKDPAYAGNVDHQAVEEQRISDKIKREKAKDPGNKGKPDAVVTAETPVLPDKPAQPKDQKSPKESDIKVKSKAGSLAMDAFNPKPRNAYEALLPTSVNDLPGQVDAGFQDYVDDKIKEGDRIDINTSEYRYIGYFTSMRKAIELVWNYPNEASRKGLQGEVGLEFAIGKDGRASRIRVIKSSGYEVLDRAIIDAIKLASPFSPLPDGFNRQRIVVTGSFRYILSAYGSH